MNYSIVEINGKQYKAIPGKTIMVDRIDGEIDQVLDLNTVMLKVADDAIEVGAPFVENTKVQVKILEHSKADKIRVAKFKAKSRYRKVQGHRQLQTLLEVLGDSSKKTTKKN